MAEFKIGQGNNRNTLLCYKVKKKPKNNSNMFKLHRNQFEGTLIGQIWDYVII